MILNMPKWLRRSIIVMRVVCPLNALSSALVGYANYVTGHYWMMYAMIACVLISIALTYVEWFYLQLGPIDLESEAGRRFLKRFLPKIIR